MSAPMWRRPVDHAFRCRDATEAFDTAVSAVTALLLLTLLALLFAGTY